MLDYQKMIEDIDRLMEAQDSFLGNMELKTLPHSDIFSQEEAGRTANLLGKIYSISHCVSCEACGGKYKKMEQKDFEGKIADLERKVAILNQILSEPKGHVCIPCPRCTLPHYQCNHPNTLPYGNYEILC